MSKFLLALDQATQTTGFSIWKDGQLLNYGHKTINGTDYMQRIAELRGWVAGAIDSVDGDMDVAIEDIQLQELGKGDLGLQTYKKLAHVQGALLSLFVDKNIKYDIVMASSWKSTCGIKGRNRDQQKANAQKFVKEKFGVDATQDEADAICIGYHMTQQKPNFNWA